MITTTYSQDHLGYQSFVMEGLTDSRADLLDGIKLLAERLSRTADTQAKRDLADAQRELKATKAKLADALMEQAKKDTRIASRDAELSKLRKANTELVAELAKLRSKLGDLLYPNVLTASGAPVFTNDWSVCGICGITGCFNMQHEGGPYCLRHTPYRSDRDAE